MPHTVCATWSDKTVTRTGGGLRAEVKLSVRGVRGSRFKRVFFLFWRRGRKTWLVLPIGVARGGQSSRRACSRRMVVEWCDAHSGVLFAICMRGARFRTRIHA